MVNKLFFFNPDCELAIANGSNYYMPPSNICLMRRDLGFLFAYVATSDDYVLVERKSDTAFLQTRKTILGLTCRELIRDEWSDFNISGLEPWGWSPQVCHDFREIPDVKPWKSERKELYSRKMAKQCLEKLLSMLPFVEKDCVPAVCYSIEEIEFIAKEGKYMVKAPWSSSGKGLLMLENGVSVKEKEWLSGMLRRQGYLMLEKYRHKVYDFAMEFYASPERVEFIGLSAFYTGENGEYRGNYVGPQQHIEDDLTNYLGTAVFNQLKQVMPGVLTELFVPHYEGYFGVDMMIYQDSVGKMYLQPCLEINLRYNMGIIALLISQKYLDKDTSGLFAIHYYPKSVAALTDYSVQQKNFPLEYEMGKIKSGYLNLTPVMEDTHFTAALYLSCDR